MTASPSSLSGQDLSFLAWESERRAMHIAVRAEFILPPGAPAPTLGEVRGALAARIRDEPRLQSRLRGRRWEPAPDFRIERHVRQAALPADRLLATPLDRGHPLWEIWLAPVEPGHHGFTLLVKIHHALIDGIAGVALLERLLGGTPRARRPRPRVRRERHRGSLSLSAALRFLGEHFKGSAATPLNGGAAEARRHLELELHAEDFEARAKQLGVTRNDLLLAACAGALRRWLRGEMALPLPEALRAFCPVSLRERGQREGFGNRISPWFVSLPIAEADPATRARRIHAQTRRLKRRREQRGGDGVARIVRRLGGWVARLGMAIAAWRRAFSLVVTNVPGPGRPLALLGARLDRLFAYAPLFPGQRLAVAVLRYDGRLCIGISEAFEDGGRGARFAAALHQELAELAPQRTT